MSTKTENGNVNETRLAFGEHLEELRKRIIYCVIAIIFCFGICWFFKTTILLIARRPHLIAMEKFGLAPNLQVLSYQEGFYAYMKLCFISAIFFAYPIIMYQIWKFVSPGLYKKEQKYYLLFMLVSFFTFIIGISFGYIFLIPIGLQFLIGILGPGVAPIITMGQYISFVFMLTFALGLVFQLPLVMLLLTKTGMFTAEKFISCRKYAILSAFIIGAVITPPDPVSQIMAAVPMIALYEAGIIAAKPTKMGVLYFGCIMGGGVLSIFLFFVAFSHFSTIGAIVFANGVVVLGSSETNNGYKININKNNARENVKVQKGMSLKTGSNGKTNFEATNGVKVALDCETEVTIVGKRAINVLNGQIFLSVPDIKIDFNVFTANGNVLTQSGDINIKVLPFETVVTVAEGSADLCNGNIKKTILKGRQGRITNGGDAVNVDDVIEWIGE